MMQVIGLEIGPTGILFIWAVGSNLMTLITPMTLIGPGPLPTLVLFIRRSLTTELGRDERAGHGGGGLLGGGMAMKG